MKSPRDVRGRLADLLRPTGAEDLLRVTFPEDLVESSQPDGGIRYGPSPRWQVSTTHAIAVLAVLACVSALALGWAVYGRSSGNPSTLPAASARPSASVAGNGTPPPGAGAAGAEAFSLLPGTSPSPVASGTAAPSVSTQVVVSVVGKVERPGLVTLPPGARVADALAQAGIAAEAQVHMVNQARKVADGEQIYLPGPGEAPPVLADGTATGRNSSPGSGVGQGTGSGTGATNINTADAASLEQLPGVGPKTAEAILRHRDTHGPFASVDDLVKVTGIGPATLARLIDAGITV